MTDSPTNPPPLLYFTPVPRKILRRHDGLTVDRAAWKLIVGPTDWTKVEGWDGDEPTQFANDNMTRPSTIVSMAMPIDTAGTTASKAIFGENRSEKGKG